MSCFTRRHRHPNFDREYGEIEEDAERNFAQDQVPPECNPCLKSKLISFFKSGGITTVMNRVVSCGSSLLNRLSARQTNGDSPSHLDETVRKSFIPVTETVNFPSHTAPAATKPFSQSPNPDPLAGFIITAYPPLPPLHVNDDPSVVVSGLSQVTKDECLDLEDFRRKETKSTEKTFPEIGQGIVRVRATWLGPLLTGKTADEKNSSLPVRITEPNLSGNSTNEKPSARAIPRQGDPNMSMEKSFLVSESEEESSMDDSSCLDKHRHPKDETKTWVEPGIVARRALWLEPILNGMEQTLSV